MAEDANGRDPGLSRLAAGGHADSARAADREQSLAAPQLGALLGVVKPDLARVAHARLKSPADSGADLPLAGAGGQPGVDQCGCRDPLLQQTGAD